MAVSRPLAVIVSPDPASSVGGVERMCHLLAEVLERADWTVRLVGPDSKPTKWQSRLGVHYLASSLASTRAARKLKPNLLITNGFLGFGLSWRVPRVHIYHGTMVGATLATGDTLPRRERTKRIIGAGAAEALSGRGAAAVVCVSELAARQARSFYRVKCDAVIPNGIDTTTFGPRTRAQARARLGLSSEERYALFVGRLDPGKGADLLVAATTRAGFRLLIAGNTGAPGAHHLGVLPPQELADAYSAADCALLPSLYEACSYVVLEALACGCPLLTTNVGWMPTLLHSVPAYETLCVAPDVKEIANRLQALPDLETDKLTSEARAFVLENNSLERYSEHWQAVLRDLTRRGWLQSP